MGAGVTGGGTLLAGVSLLTDWGLALAASIGAGVVLVLVLVVMRRVRSVMTLLILGLMFGYMTGALVSMLMHFTLTEKIRAYVSWTYGSFSGVTWSQLQIFVPIVLIGLALAFFMAKTLNALLLGETYARSMGLNIRRARFAIITGTALLAGTVTAFCGPIGFIGIAAPHICRGLFKTSDHRILVPASILTGGLGALIATLIAEVPGSDIVLPLNAVTALIGAPFVVWIILRRRDLRETFAG
jgi:iron complex transport system permease protein